MAPGWSPSSLPGVAQSGCVPVTVAVVSAAAGPPEPSASRHAAATTRRPRSTPREPPWERITRCIGSHGERAHSRSGEPALPPKRASSRSPLAARNPSGEQRQRRQRGVEHVRQHQRQPERQRHRRPGQRDAQVQPRGGGQEQREEDEVARADLGDAVGAERVECQGERVQHLLVLLDDHLGRPGGDAVDVDGGDQQRDRHDLDRRLEQRRQRHADQRRGHQLGDRRRQAVEPDHDRAAPRPRPPRRTARPAPGRATPSAAAARARRRSPAGSRPARGLPPPPRPAPRAGAGKTTSTAASAAAASPARLSTAAGSRTTRPAP